MCVSIMWSTNVQSSLQGHTADERQKWTWQQHIGNSVPFPVWVSKLTQHSVPVATCDTTQSSFENELYSVANSCYKTKMGDGYYKSMWLEKLVHNIFIDHNTEKWKKNCFIKVNTEHPFSGYSWMSSDPFLHTPSPSPQI